jgi:trehalose/maltose transport system substrate-binding protein
MTTHVRKHQMGPGRWFLVCVAAITISAVAITSGVGKRGKPSSWPADRVYHKTIVIVSGTDTSLSAGSHPVTKDVAGMYQQLVQWWNANEADREHFTLVLDTVTGGATVEHSEMLAAAQAGGPYDIYNLDSQWVSEFAHGGYIRSLQNSGIDIHGFLHGPLHSAEDANGDLYALPFTTDVGLLYYRSDLVRPHVAGHLRSFNDMMRVARIAASKPGSGVREGYAGQFADYEGLTVNTLEAIWDRDPYAFAANGTVNDRNAVSAGIQDLASAFARSGSGPPAISPGELNYDEAQALRDFSTRKAVFMRNWPIYYEQLAAPTSRQKAKAKAYVSSHFGVAALPFPSALGGQDLAIAKSSPDPREARTAIEFLTSPWSERCLFAVGGFPATRRRAYANSGWLPPDGRCGKSVGSSVKSGPVRIGQQILASLDRAIPRPTTPYYTEFSDLLQTRVTDILAGRKPAVPAALTLASDLQVAAEDGQAPP